MKNPSIAEMLLGLAALIGAAWSLGSLIWITA
jgi:hypothetical protein